MAESIDSVFDELQDRWDVGDAAAPALLASAGRAVGGALPEDLATFYRRADGAEIGNVAMFTIEEFVDVNGRRTKGQANAVFFASDGADGFFFLDLANRMKRGTGAVGWSSRSDTRGKQWIYTARDLASFLRLVDSGETPWQAPSVAEIDVAQMVAALDSRRDRWSGGPPADFAAIRDAGVRVGILMPEEIEALLEISDGFEMPAAGVQLYGTGDLAAVPGTTKSNGRPGALWFAEDRLGTRYAVTTIGWRESEGGDVVKVAVGDAPATAPIVGTVPDAVVAWLDGRTI